MVQPRKKRQGILTASVSPFFSVFNQMGGRNVYQKAFPSSELLKQKIAFTPLQKLNWESHENLLLLSYCDKR